MFKLFLNNVQLGNYATANEFNAAIGGVCMVGRIYKRVKRAKISNVQFAVDDDGNTVLKLFTE